MHDIFGFIKEITNDFGRNTEMETKLQSAMSLLEECGGIQHALDVTRIALDIFDGLSGLHGFGEDERFYLKNAALLHDSGYALSYNAHHKQALKLIMMTDTLNFSEEERVIIGLIARYHRKSHPKEKHKYYGGLSEEDKHRVCALSSILRVADALDRSHDSYVKDTIVSFDDDMIRMQLISKMNCSIEIARAKEKSKLMSSIFDRQIKFERKAYTNS